jgi:hypothetical protein
VTINPGDAGLASEGGHLHSTTLEEGDMLRGSLVLLAGIVAVAGQARAGEGARVVCSNGTIQGEYTFTVHGKTLNPRTEKSPDCRTRLGS